MTLPVADFLQRWLLHVPGPHTRVVRSYGLSHHAHTAALAHCRAALGQPPVEPPPDLDWQTVCAQRGDAHPEQCPTCGQLLVCTGVIPRGGHRRPCGRGSVRHETRTQETPARVWCAWRLPCGDPTGPGGALSTLGTLGTARTPSRVGCQGRRRHMGVGVTRHNLHSARRSTPVRPYRYTVSPTLMRAPVVKRQTLPNSVFCPFFPLWFRPASFASSNAFRLHFRLRAHQRDCTKHFSRVSCYR